MRLERDLLFRKRVVVIVVVLSCCYLFLVVVVVVVVVVALGSRSSHRRTSPPRPLFPGGGVDDASCKEEFREKVKKTKTNSGKKIVGGVREKCSRKSGRRVRMLRKRCSRARGYFYVMMFSCGLCSNVQPLVREKETDGG